MGVFMFNLDKLSNEDIIDLLFKYDLSEKILIILLKIGDM